MAAKIKSAGCNLLGLFLIALLVLPEPARAITTTHHDKSLETKLTVAQRIDNLTTTNIERQKRLLPYYNFYLSEDVNPLHQKIYTKSPSRPQKYTNYQPTTHYQNYPNYFKPRQEILYRPKGKFTPFLDSNALAGPFIPIQKPERINYNDNEKFNNYGSLYEKLTQLKLVQQQPPESYIQNNYRAVPQYPQTQHNYDRKPQIEFVPVREYQVQEILPPTKTIVQTYKPTEIEITAEEMRPYHPEDEPQPSPLDNKKILKNYPQYEDEDPTSPQALLNHDFAHPITSEEQRQYVEDQKEYLGEKTATINRRPPVTYTEDPVQIQTPVYRKPYQPLIKIDPVRHNYVPTYKYQLKPKYETIQLTSIAPPTTLPPPIVETHQPQVLTENPNSLGQILKQLQDSNTLPQTLTPDNIDNSIKTLVRILNSLKKQPKFTSPIVVADENAEYADENETEAGINNHGGNLGGEVTTQNFPAITGQGGTPGKAGVDYPALSTIPKTSFSCKTQRYKGFFGDPDTNCQVWHYCDLNGGQASFLCPNGTIFSQVALTCDWWFNVKCSSTPQLYVLNERLYKYILPLSPKFPEDYTGPLVDKYLALKFQEMEEKMRKEKKGKVTENSEESTDGADEELQQGEVEEVDDEENASTHDYANSAE